MSAEVRFGFGQNWSKYLSVLTENRVREAESSIVEMLGGIPVEGLSVLDIGSGSGLFSLAVRNMGAAVTSFDYDQNSVACTERVRETYRQGDKDWHISQGSVLDQKFMSSLGKFDLVYSWGVLHHTGQMWMALDNAIDCVGEKGRLLIALYNDQGWISHYWTVVKRIYNAGMPGRLAMILLHAPYLLGARYISRLFSGRKLERGMSLWYDMLDWLGGYPFEVAKPVEVIAHVQSKGYTLVKSRLCGTRHGCNEFLFQKTA
jgi:2-polyprenyl-6-hydroxyphenyl methylase/3-demethylubiquinone-9 3-methyltransferase